MPPFQGFDNNNIAILIYINISHSGFLQSGTDDINIDNTIDLMFKTLKG